MQAAQRLIDLSLLLNQQQYRQSVFGHGLQRIQGLPCGCRTQLLLDAQLDLSRKLQRQVGMQQRKELVMKLRQQLLPKMAWQLVEQLADARQLGRRSCAAWLSPHFVTLQATRDHRCLMWNSGPSWLDFRKYDHPLQFVIKLVGNMWWYLLACWSLETHLSLSLSGRPLSVKWR